MSRARTSKPKVAANGGTQRKRRYAGDTLHEPPIAEQVIADKQAELEAKANELLRGDKPAEVVDGDGVVTPLPTGKAAKAAKRKAGDKVRTTGTMIKQRFERMLPVKLTQPELRDKSRGLANTVTEIKSVVARKKIANDGFADELERWNGIQASLSRQVDTGEEHRPVKCREVHDYQHRQVITYRDDTNEVVHQREMNDDELQLGFELDEAV